MYCLGVRHEFMARHFLVGGDWGEENIEHSHRYRLEVVLEGESLDRHGFLVDIVEVRTHLEEVVAGFREKTLNEMPELAGGNPSIERLAAAILRRLRERLGGRGLAALEVFVHEDDIAWTSCRESF